MKTKTEAKEDEVRTRIYEVGYLLTPAIIEEEVTGKVDEIRKIIESNKGRIISEGNPKLRDLAYEISKIISNKKETYKSGYFGWIKFEGDREQIKKINIELKKDTEIIRFVLTKTVLEDTLAIIEKTLAIEAEEKARTIVKEEDKVVKFKDRGNKRKKEEGIKSISKEEIDETIEKLIIE